MKIPFIETRTAPKAIYLYTYGDNLTQTEGKKRLLKHCLGVGSYIYASITCKCAKAIG